MMIKKLFTIIAIVANSLSFGQKISTGGTHSMFLCPNGSVKVCGNNNYGALGLGNFTYKTLPEKNPYLSNITAIAGGYVCSLFLKDDSTVWACGYNGRGQLGIGNTINQTIPVKLDTLKGITAIAAGEEHSLFLKNDGTVWTCGGNYSGQLGNGNTSNQTIPVKIAGLSNITAIAGGNTHSLFLKSDGTVWVCGDNSYGQLGIGNGISQPTPVKLSSLSGIIALAGGDDHSLFLKNDGTVWACGGNYFGQLGVSPTINLAYSNTPVRVGNLTGIIAISARADHSLFLRNDGTVWGCGGNYSGQLGIGNTFQQNTPVQVSSLNGVTSITSGRAHSLFLKSNGTVWACGYNSKGQLGNRNTTDQTTPVNIGSICIPPATPAVNMSNMPTSICLGSNLSVDPTISGSNPQFAISIASSITITNPKAITKNKSSVFILNDADAIARYDFNGNLVSSYPNLNVTGILAFAADDSSNIYFHKGDGKLYKCDSTGTLVNTQTPLYATNTANQLVFTKPVNAAVYPENLFLVDGQQSLGTLLIGYNTYNNTASNSADYGSDSTLISHATSMCIDNFYDGKRALLADSVNNTLRTRVLYPDGSSSFNYQEDFLVPPSSTAGAKFDFIDTDTLSDIFTASSRATGILGWGSSFRNSDGLVTSYLDTSLTSLIHPVRPIGIITTQLGSTYQHWIADRGQNKIIRVYPSSYRISPPLPPGLKYNNITGEISGTPSQTTSPQMYQVILTTPYGADTTYVTFQVIPSNGLSNATGTGISSAQQSDGLMIRYINLGNCEKLIDIADSLGGTSPGETQVSQTVYPLVSVIANDSLIRRATQIKADNMDSLRVNVTFYYTYQDIQFYKQTAGSPLSNDTVGGTMQIAVLQMHDLPGGRKQPIIHSPVTATWSHTEHNWKAIVSVTKFSEFYAGDMATLNNFDCRNSGKDTLISNDYYVWNYDTLFTSGDYVDTLTNHTGCDSLARLHLTVNRTTGLNEAALASGISVFPNPSNGIFNIRFNNTAVMPATIKVFSVIGTEVMNKTLTANDTIDLSAYQSGIYYLIIENNASTKTWRIVKQH